MEFYYNFLNTLRSIDWKNINGVRNNCAFINQRFNDLEVNEKSLWDFESHLYSDRRLSEGAFYILPFLCNSIRMSGFTQKEIIFDNLFEILNGYAAFDEKVNYTVRLDPFIHFVPSNKQEAIKQPLVIACRTYLSSNLDLFLNQLKEDNSLIRDVLDIITSFKEYEHLVITTLIDNHNTIHENEKKTIIKELLLEFVRDTDFFDLNNIKNQLK
ncbi:hypothetical protein [uncultured Aquimarina sp.]|uniref:hypothetical protein n=1 Tax=uncultured Aquimarina sp. TaxID=575652 RepID=UPI0026307430|nr:hypothetical protein [uncultured Aquimarina sp.]